MVRVGIVGCGAVAEKGHLPAFNSISDVEITALVDKNLNRARELGVRYNVPLVTDTYSEIYDDIDAVVLALPHFLHCTAAIDFLKQKKYVLIEKPMALSSSECQTMIAASEKNEVGISVGLMRRYLPAHQLMKKILQKKTYGDLLEFRFLEGNVYNWPVTSDFFFKKETAGGGVLFDTGAHTIDSLIWWLGYPKSFHYYDDAFGGVEADCRIEIELDSGVSGFVELSRTRDLSNCAEFIFEDAQVIVNLRKNEIRLSHDSGISGIQGSVFNEQITQPIDIPFNYLFVLQAEDWISSTISNRPSLISGYEAMKSVSFIEQCYLRKGKLDLPWMEVV